MEVVGLEIDMTKEYEKPREICIESTTACNCGCDFCYNNNSFAKDGRKTEFLSTEDIKRIIDIASDAKISRIRFTGGEPLLRKDIFELGAYARERGLQTVLNTNGTLIDKEIGKKVVDIFNICLISFFSMRKEYVDGITNVPGTFERKINALENIQGCEQIWCSTIIGDPHLVEDLFDMSDFMDKYNVYNWFLLRTNPIEANKEPHTFEEMEKLIDRILELKEKKGKVLPIGNPLPFCCYKPKELADIVSTGVLYAEGRTKMVVDPHGQVVVDYCIDTPVGNILEEDVLKLWHSEEIKLIRGDKYLPDLCKKCKIVNKCWGGSRFASKIINGTYGGMDPLARPEKYKEELFNDKSINVDNYLLIGN